MSPSLARGARQIVRLTRLAWVIFSASAAFLFMPGHRRDLAARARWLQRISMRLRSVLGVECVTPAVLPPASIIVANHLGYLDIVVLSSLIPVVFVAKAEVRGWPVFGWFARRAGTRFIDRENRADVARVAEELRTPLELGLSVVLFLEGTSSDGTGVLPFKSSLLEPAVRNGWPVTPVALGYEVSAGHSVSLEVCWWGEMTLLPHLFNLMALPKITSRVAWGEPIRGATDRKQLAAALHARVVALHGALGNSSA